MTSMIPNIPMAQAAPAQPLMPMPPMMPEYAPFPAHAAMPSNCKPWPLFAAPCDPCPPRRMKCYLTPPNLYAGFQPMNLPQFAPSEALRAGTLWPLFYSPYPCK